MKYVTIERAVSAFRFGKHIPPKWYMDLLNRGKVFASRQRKRRRTKTKNRITRQDVPCRPRRLDSIRPRRQNKRAFP
jgi:hypothetical protein